MEVLVFKTNVISKKELRRVTPLLNSFPAICQWNFDLQDCDKILRIEAAGLNPNLVELLLHEAGFHCQELD